MPQFDYASKLIGLPAKMKATKGQGVKIALIDKGANLTLPALSHHDVEGRKFDVTIAGFDPQTAEGKDDISDALPNSDLHGTQLLSILGANSPEDDGIIGMAPNAEIYIIKILDTNKATRQEYILCALQLCIRLDVDIICNSSFPRITNRADLPLIDQALANLKAQNIIFVSSLKNSGLPARLNKLGFPSRLPYSLVTGVPQKKLLKKLPDEFKWTKGIEFLFPELPIKSYTASDNSSGQTIDARSSHATAALTGALALQIAHWKATETNYRRRSKADLITAFAENCPKFNKGEMSSNAPFQFFRVGANGTNPS